MKVNECFVEVFIPRSAANKDPNFYVGINGVSYLLPRGRKSRIPAAAAQVGACRLHIVDRPQVLAIVGIGQEAQHAVEVQGRYRREPSRVAFPRDAVVVVVGRHIVRDDLIV